MKYPPQPSTGKSRALLRVLIQSLLMVAAVAFMMASIGCATAPQEAAMPPQDLAKAAGCPDPSPLDVPQGINSAQLEGIIYGAYLDLLAQYIACQQVGR